MQVVSLPINSKLSVAGKLETPKKILKMLRIKGNVSG